MVDRHVRQDSAMTGDEAMDACAAFPAVVLEYPFGPETAVFKVVGKMFAALNESMVTLKADPEDARALVQAFTEMSPGYHMNKKHWISVALPSGSAPLEELIRDS